MASRIRVDPIPVSAGFLSSAKQRRAVQNFLDATAEDIRIDFGVTTQTWKNRPDFAIETPDETTRKVGTDNMIYKFVSGGTRVRYATMTPGFQAKTVPGWIGSRPGAGGRMFVDKSKPRPGIKARNFHQEIIRKWQPRLAGLLRRMIAAELSHR